MTQRSGRQSVIQLTTLWPNVSRDDNNLRSFHDGKLSPFVFLSCPKKVPRGSLIICRFLPIGFLHLLKKRSLIFSPLFLAQNFGPFCHTRFVDAIPFGLNQVGVTGHDFPSVFQVQSALTHDKNSASFSDMPPFSYSFRIREQSDFWLLSLQNYF